MHFRAHSVVAGEELYTMFREEHLDILFSDELNELVRERLGPGFIAYVTAEPSSLELWVTIAVSGEAAYRVYKAIGEYPQFREGFLRLISDIERFVYSRLSDRAIFPVANIVITTVGNQLGPSLAAAETYATVAPLAKQFRHFLIYISIITTALLVCGVILLLTLVI